MHFGLYFVLSMTCSFDLLFILLLCFNQSELFINQKKNLDVFVGNTKEFQLNYENPISFYKFVRMNSACLSGHSWPVGHIKIVNMRT